MRLCGSMRLSRRMQYIIFVIACTGLLLWVRRSVTNDGKLARRGAGIRNRARAHTHTNTGAELRVRKGSKSHASESEEGADDGEYHSVLDALAGARAFFALPQQHEADTENELKIEKETDDTAGQVGGVHPEEEEAKVDAGKVPPPRPDRKYLLLLQGVEGFGAWSDSIIETMHVAKELNRTWVEPCVRNGCIEPCRCAHIPEVPPFDRARVDAGEDPFLLPRFDYDCKIDMSFNHPDPKVLAPAYPLSAFLDVEALKSMHYDNVVTYKEWCEDYGARHQDTYDPDTRRWKEAHTYCYDMVANGCEGNRQLQVGDFFFSKDIRGWIADPRGHLQEDKSDNIFFYHYYRGAFGMVHKFPSAPINKWHHAVVEKFIRDRFGDDGYVAFHWRSERNVDPRRIVNCSADIAEMTKRNLPVLSGPRSHALLVSDMPSPNNPNKMWTDYLDGAEENRHVAMATMINAGFIKYDALQVNASRIDGGVFSVRDYLFSLKASLYVSCQGDHWKDCHGCFREGSNIVHRIHLDRNAMQKPVSLNWYQLTAKDLPAPLDQWPEVVGATASPQPLVAAPSSSPAARTRKYLLLMQGLEGFGAWSDSIMETLLVAKQLNRTWVEPCVRNGCIEPCSCSNMVDIPAFDPSKAAAGDDPLLLPRINVDCKLDLFLNTPNPPPPSQSYPLSAYIDVEALKEQYYSDIITYKDWCADYKWRHGDVDPHLKRWKEETAYCYQMTPQYCAGNTRTVYVGDFAFKGDKVGWAPPNGLEILQKDDSENIFMYTYYRGAFSMVNLHPSIPISKWHHAAVDRLISQRFGGDGYAAFHWRSETGVAPTSLAACATGLVNMTESRLPVLGKDRPHAVLVSDMPAPINANRMWNDYVGGDSDLHKQAMKIMIDGGFMKYDAVLPNPSAVDGGVLSVRDYLLAVKADMYVTCQGDHWKDCHGCFRAGSNIVGRIVKDRTASNKPFSTSWYSLTRDELPQSLKALPMPAPYRELSVSASPAPPSQRYLLLMQGMEGFGAWSDSIYQTLEAAKQLGRKWVEPCVRNGCLEPCRCNALPKMPPFDQTAADAGADPLLLPRFNFDCKADMHYNSPVAQRLIPAYPLSAYVDLDELRKQYDHIVTYREWCADYKARYGPFDPALTRWKGSRAYCFEMNPIDCVKNEKRVLLGDFVFMDGDIPAFAKGLEFLRKDESENVFLYAYFRGGLPGPQEHTSVPINRWHHAAVDRFIQDHFGKDAFATFHWRSERNVDTKVLVPCSEKLVAATNSRMPGLLGPQSHAVLVADMPAPGNANKMWTDYLEGGSDTHREAMRVMLDGGFIKYDATVVNASNIDAGVFSIRDYLLAVKATSYITCQGDHWKDCQGCFRSGSNIVGRISIDRTHAGQPSSFKWFHTARADLPAALQKVLEGGAGAARKR